MILTMSCDVENAGWGYDSLCEEDINADHCRCFNGNQLAPPEARCTCQPPNVGEDCTSQGNGFCVAGSRCVAYSQMIEEIVTTGALD